MIALAAFAVTACTVDSAKRHYVLAEKLWTDGKYAAAVSEFEKVTAKDPHGKLGLQALLRAANTQALFLTQYPEAIEKLKLYINANPDSTEGDVWEARKAIGDLLYNKTEQYEQALRYYKNLSRLRPHAPEAPEFLLRIARSEFFLAKFQDALSAYAEVTRTYPGTEAAEHAAFETAQTYLAQGERAGGGRDSRDSQDLLKRAMASYTAFLKQYPQSRFVPEAQFGVASCMEAMDQLDAAYQAYAALRSTYPSPKVIEIKLARIQERKAQRSH